MLKIHAVNIQHFSFPLIVVNRIIMKLKILKFLPVTEEAAATSLIWQYHIQHCTVSYYYQKRAVSGI